GGFDAPTLNVLTELWLGYGLGEYSGTRGFPPERLDAALALLQERGWADGPALTGTGVGVRLALEDATNAAQSTLVGALGAELEGVVERAEAISARILDAGAFPTDPRKRAGG